MQFRTSDQKIRKIFQTASVKPEIHYIPVDAGKRRLRYIKVSKSDTLPLVVFVHGAPGSSDVFFGFMRDSLLTDKFQMISVDRVGYGYSNFGKSETSILNQAKFIQEIPDLKNYKTILVGHSFGAPIIARMAIEYPDKISSLVLVAGTIDPASEQIFWISYPANWKLFRWMVPNAFKVANDEKLEHVSELKKLDPLWKDIKKPMTIIQGGKDFLAPVSNLTFIKERVDSTLLDVIFVPKMNHFVPWSHPELIRNSLLKNRAYLNK